MNFKSRSAIPRLAKVALGAFALVGGVSANALTFVATSPDFVGSGQPPATQVVGSFSYSSSQLALLSSSNIASLTVSGVWGGGAYQTGTDTFETAPSDLYIDGIKLATCGPYAECSSGYSPTYEGLETWSYTFSSSQYGGLLSALASGPLTLTSVLDSPYTQNYANALSDLQMTVSTGAVAAVPEPGSYALMLLGMGVIAAVGRKRALRSRTVV